ncbi:Ferric siderophore transport system, periplasmic binding protein TonB [hydrothermal vent metagenome]|uniref:Ferric siderophore transport system, periplasmic binding protein TonB n=1 Tax=hydrothermal vent metagenome TaxID=652676 RepID=A0A3B0Z279_9ZZZZ
MTITRQQTGIALLVALILHGGILFWLALPAPEPRVKPPEQIVRVSLLATIAETSTATEAVTPPQKKIKPLVTPKPKPVPKPEIQEPLPKPVAEPITKQPVPEPPPVIEPAPQPVPLPIENPPEIVKEAAPIQEPPVAAPSPAPLSATAMAEYEQLLAAWLDKQKKYPKRAKRMRIEGEGQLRIVIDRSGQTQKITLEQGTGNRLLDKAALDMAKRANPFPPMPENDLRQTLEFIVPVEFALR